jgi:hypothetical protein
MKRAAVAIVVALAMLLAVFLTNKYLVGSISFVARQDDPKQIEEYIHYLEALLTSIDQLVSMLVTIQLSLFVLAGFALNKRLRETHVASVTLISLGSIFMLTALMSLTLGYTARIQALTLIQFGTWHFESVQTTVIWQSILLVLSAVAAGCMMLVALLDRNAAIREEEK